jgi:hypothetical protein
MRNIDVGNREQPSTVTPVVSNFRSEPCRAGATVHAPRKQRLLEIRELVTFAS